MENDLEPSLFRTEVDRRYYAVVEHIMAKENEISLSKMSKKLGDGEQFLSKIKTGKQSAGQKMIQLVVNQYNVDANWLYTGQGKMFKESASITNQNITDNQKGDNIAGHRATIHKSGGEDDEEKRTLRKKLEDATQQLLDSKSKIIELMEKLNNQKCFSLS